MYYGNVDNTLSTVIPEPRSGIQDPIVFGANTGLYGLLSVATTAFQYNDPEYKERINRSRLSLCSAGMTKERVKLVVNDNEYQL